MRLAVFASGTGSNFEAIAQAIDKQELNASIVLLVCDKKQALVIEKAKRRSIDVFVFDPKEYSTKAAYEMQILEVLRQKAVDFLVLAGYMRLIGETLLKQYPRRIVNIHPSLLPKYKGKNALEQALRHGDEILGVSVHYVDETLDGGEIIAQASFAKDGRNMEEIEAQLHQIEHKLYVDVLKKVIQEAV